MRPGLALPVFALLLAVAAGCSHLGMDSPFTADPLTGGVDAHTSALLNAPLPGGLQRYPSHSFSQSGPNGTEGLETLRGNVDANAAALAMFNTLKTQGWQLRMSSRKGARSIYLYQKGDECCALSFHPQGMLTILEIWRGQRLPDGSLLSMPEARPDEGISSLPGEEFGPLENKSEPRNAAPGNGNIEHWGSGTTIEEREI